MSCREKESPPNSHPWQGDRTLLPPEALRAPSGETCGYLEGHLVWPGALFQLLTLLTQSFNYSSDTSYSQEGFAGV